MNLISEFEKRNVYEETLTKQGYKFIAGVDEVGRGPLAGPLCVGAVILDPEQKILGLKDSKKLSSKKIDQLAKEIKQKSLAYTTTFVSAKVIDKIGMSAAIDLAMKRVVSNLEINADFVLVDFTKIKFTKIESLSIKKGDDKSNTIAAAAIIAKDRRDKYMIKLSKEYPEYGFDTHVGYGTKKHIEAINKFGPIRDVHRYTFKPIKKE